MKVSNDFVEIYKKFNVVNQVEKMKSLSRKELLLLLVLGVDSFDENSLAAIDNYREFKTELESIFAIQNDEEPTDTDLIDLIALTSDKKIDTSVIVDENGGKLPNPLSEAEAMILRREIGIDTIIN